MSRLASSRAVLGPRLPVQHKVLRAHHLPHPLYRKRLRRDDHPCAPIHSSRDEEPGLAPSQPSLERDAASSDASQATQTTASAPASPASNGSGAPDAAAPEQQQPALGAASSSVGTKLTWRRLLMRTVRTLGANLWPLLLVHLACDVLVFGLHRLSHRLTNEGARGQASRSCATWHGGCIRMHAGCDSPRRCRFTPLAASAAVVQPTRPQT